MSKLPVAILGATGAVGQRFVAMLSDHPWFEIHSLHASERSAGRPYSEATRWLLPGDPPPAIADMTVRDCTPDERARIAFSGLDASVAGEVEQAWARVGALVSSNARNHRQDADVPLVVPEINASHLDLLDRQAESRGWAPGGGILTNPNCSTIGLVMGLAPIDRAFGVEQVLVTTLQAASGAGYPGVPSMDLLGNAVPFIGGEEPKMESETRKILGRLVEGRVRAAEMTVSASVHRVPVVDGHLEAISVRTARPALPEKVASVLREFSGQPQELGLPSAPAHPICVLAEDDRPQPRLDVERGGGMVVSVGRIRECPVLGVKLELLVHNTVRGAAGCAILNAETLLARRGETPAS